MASPISESSSDMEYVMSNNDELLEEIEVSETDVALLRDLLEELENEEIIVNKSTINDAIQGNCLTQSAAVDEISEANYDVFDDHKHVSLEQHHEFSCMYDPSSVEMMETNTTSSFAPQGDDVAVPDWYACDDEVGTVGFDYCNNIGDYSYLYNEITYCYLWEQDN